jgi:hypothetical protein
MRSASLAGLAYAAIAVVMTWPLGRHLATSLASDLGDPALNCWVLLWTAGQALAALTGDVAALGNYWNGNIYYPEPLALTYSEHLTPQMLQILPVYAATGNIVLSYNLLFLATFALSGLTMYLFVRELTENRLAAFVAGLAFAYAPYRLGQFSHLQVLSSFWMPLALLGVRRYFESRSLTALAGGAAALVAQSLSCGYYLLFCPPFVAGYAVYEMTRRKLLGDRRVWLSLAGAGVVALIVTWPFVRPYGQVRERGQIGVRSAEEISMFSADTHAFGTLAPSSRVRFWRETFSGYPKPEGEGFVGLTIAALAVVAVVAGLVRRLRALPWAALPAWRFAGIVVSGVAAAACIYVVATLFVDGRFAVNLGGTSTVFRNSTRPLLMGATAIAVFTALTRTRSIGREVGFFAWALVAAALCALGPRIEAAGQPLGPGPYAWLLELPGFDGFRVPARFLMIVACFFGVLAGLGAATLMSRLKRPHASTLAAAALSAAILAEAWMAPLSLSAPVGAAESLVTPRRLQAGKELSPIYAMIRRLPDPVVLIEFPFGDPAYELQAMVAAGHHRRPILNGYSGFFPPSYSSRQSVLRGLPYLFDQADLDRAAAVLRASGATHALVHEGAYRDDLGRATSDWLVSIGARLAASDGADKLFEVR